VWWNNRDTESTPYLRDYEDLIVRYNPSHSPGYRRVELGPILERSGLFHRSERHQWRHALPSDVERFVGYARTVSYVRTALADDRLAAFEAELREILHGHHGDQPFEIPYQTIYHAAEIR
jgi:hypothetical protein